MAAICPTYKSSWLFVEARAGISNDLFTDREQGIARKILIEAEEEINLLEAEIEQLDALRDRLVERLKLNKIRVLKLRAAIAPHKLLPPEVLTKIFVQCLDGMPVPVPPDSMSAVPWSLSQVCSKWRAVCQAEPALWNRLHVWSFDYDPQLAFVRNILSSSCHPRRVKLILNPESHAHWANTLDLVMSYRSQLHGLGLELNDSCLIPLAQPLSPFNDLQSLSVRFEGFPTLLRRGGPPIAAFSTASNLRKLTIESITHPDFSEQIKNVFPWSQLTDITLINVSKSSAFLVFGYCHQLINLNLSLCSGMVTPNFTNTIVFPNLRSITLNARGTIKKILKPLVTPSLKDMVFISESGVPCVDGVDIISLIQRSSCQVDSIQIQGFLVAVENVVPLMQAMPQLTTWKVSTAGPITASIISTILKENLVPNLRVLHDWEVLSVPSAVSFLRERHAQAVAIGGTGIIDARMWITHDGWSYEDEAYFRRMLPELRAQGQRVSVTPRSSTRIFGNWG